MLPARILNKALVDRKFVHPILLVPGKVSIHCVYTCVHIDAENVKESDTRDRRIKRKYEPS